MKYSNSPKNILYTLLAIFFLAIPPIAHASNSTPIIAISNSSSSSTYTEGSLVTLTAAATDSEDGDLTGSIQWSSNISGNLITGAVFSISSLSIGTHTITASVSDSSSALVSATQTVTITDSSTSTVTASASAVTDAAPFIGIVFPIDGQQYLEGSEIAFMGLAGDPEDGVLTTLIEWSSSIDGSLGNNYPRLTNLSTGIHIITARVSDSAGNISSDSKVIYVFDAHVGNCPPVILITIPTEDNSIFQQGDSVSLGAVATDAEDGNINHLVQWTSNIDGLIGDSSFLITETLSLGTHTITATVTDDENITVSSSITVIVTVDGNLPNIASTATVTGISSFSPTKNMIDDNTISSWFSTNESSYAQFRWNETTTINGANQPKFYNVSSINLKWAGEYYAGQIDVLACKEGSCKIVESGLSVSNSNDLSIPVTGEIDSILISLKDGNMGNFFGIAEAQVFGSDAN